MINYFIRNNMSLKINFELTRINSVQNLENNRSSGKDQVRKKRRATPSAELSDCHLGENGEEESLRRVKRCKKRQFAALEELSERLLDEEVAKTGGPRYHILPQAIAYYEENGPFHSVDTSSMKRARTVEGLLTALLSQYPGVCLGEFHSQPYGLEFLIKQIKLFAELGVDAIGAEGPVRGEDQKELDDFYDSGTPSAKLEQMVRKSKFSRHWIHLLNGARKNHIRIFAIDSEKDGMQSQPLCYPGWEVPRLVRMNYFTLQIVNHYRKKVSPQAKIVIWGGIFHMDNHGDIPGIGPLLKFPSLAILGIDHRTDPYNSIIPNHPIDYDSKSNPDLRDYYAKIAGKVAPMSNLPIGTANFALF
jgi:hypothetical protein